jgi:uncharacterized protein (TIGR02147 family)
MHDFKAEPEVFLYTNYRVYLKDYYDYRKQISAVFSHRFFAAKAGLASPNYLKLVMDGTRNLSTKSLQRFVSGLALNGKRAEYFENLVHFNQAKALDQRNHFYEKLLKVRNRAGLNLLDEGQFELFTNWRNLVLREMVGLKGFKRHPKWIADQMHGAITAKEAEDSLEKLTRLGLLRKTANGYRQVDVNISTHDEVRSLLIKNYHRQMLNLAADAMDRLPATQRDISTVTIPIRKADFAKVKEHLQLMRKELLNLAAEADQGEAVVQINLQLFPLTCLDG